MRYYTDQCGTSRADAGLGNWRPIAVAPAAGLGVFSKKNPADEMAWACGQWWGRPDFRAILIGVRRSVVVHGDTMTASAIDKIKRGAPATAEVVGSCADMIPPALVAMLQGKDPVPQWLTGGWITRCSMRGG